MTQICGGLSGGSSGGGLPSFPFGIEGPVWVALLCMCAYGIWLIWLGTTRSESAEDRVLSRRLGALGGAALIGLSALVAFLYYAYNPTHRR
jgi:hypothetical protein